MAIRMWVPRSRRVSLQRAGEMPGAKVRFGLGHLATPLLFLQTIEYRGMAEFGEVAIEERPIGFVASAIEISSGAVLRDDIGLIAPDLVRLS